jgi:hypothetical protein
MVLVPSRLVLGVATGFFLSALLIAGSRFSSAFGEWSRLEALRS